MNPIKYFPHQDKTKNYTLKRWMEVPISLMMALILTIVDISLHKCALLNVPYYTILVKIWKRVTFSCIVKVT